AALHGGAIHRLLADVQTLLRRDAQKLLEERRDLTRGLRVYAQPPAAVDLKTTLFGITPCPHEHKKIRLALAIEQFVASVVGMRTLSAREQITALGQRRDQGDRPHAAIFLCREQHARVAR